MASGSFSTPTAPRSPDRSTRRSRRVAGLETALFGEPSASGTLEKVNGGKDRSIPYLLALADLDQGAPGPDPATLI